MTPIRIAALVLFTAAPAAIAGAQSAPVMPQRPRVAELVKQLKDPDWDTRMEAATALGTLGPEARTAIPNLVEALKDPVAPVRMKAIDALMFMGTGASEAAPAIIPFLDDPDELVRVSAAVALPRVTPDRASIVPLLKKALGDKAWKVRRRAAIELIAMGAETAAAAPVLREGLKDPEPSDRLEAIGILATVGSPEERTAMAAIVLGYLKDRDAETRIEATRRLSGLGPVGVPALIAVLRDEAELHKVQSAAVRALGRIGPDAKAALPVLEELKQRKGRWLKITQRSIASIQGKEPRLPEEHVGPLPPLNPTAGPNASPTPSGSPSATPSSSPSPSAPPH